MVNKKIITPFIIKKACKGKYNFSNYTTLRPLFSKNYLLNILFLIIFPIFGIIRCAYCK